VAYLVHRRQLTVEWGHCDPAGIIFNSRFFEYFDWSTALLFQAALGLTKPEMQATYDADMPLIDARATFLKPARFGDVVEIASTIGEFRCSSFDVQHRLSNRGELAAEAQETRVWVGRTELKSKLIPDEVVECFKKSG
jgi:4-hydroxybenzoyl-CoA thioesterase